jgi:hypothetical protein
MECLANQIPTFRWDVRILKLHLSAKAYHLLAEYHDKLALDLLDSFQ